MKGKGFMMSCAGGDIILEVNEYAEVKRQGHISDQTEARIDTVSCERGVITLGLTGEALKGTIVSFIGRELAPLTNANNEELEAFKVTSDGTVIYWPRLDVQVSIAVLLETVCGLRSRSLAAHLARAGSVSSEAKAIMSRINGAKGGRPRKTPNP